MLPTVSWWTANLDAGVAKARDAVEPEAKVEARPAPLITLEIEPSRGNLVAGDGIGMTGTVENVSKQVVYLNGNAFTSTLPVELEGARSAVKGYRVLSDREIRR